MCIIYAHCIHTGSIFKLFLREIKEPAIPSSFYSSFLDIGKQVKSLRQANITTKTGSSNPPPYSSSSSFSSSSSAVEAAIIERIWTILHSDAFPTQERTLLTYVFQLLFDVSLHSGALRVCVCVCV
jgi:hypothetical protein